MARIKRHLLAKPAMVVGAVGVLILFVLWAASANPMKHVERETHISSGQQLSRPVSPDSIQVVNNFAPALRLMETPQQVSTTITHQTSPAVAPPAPASALPQSVSDTVPLLNGPRQYALAMIETGNDDKAIGRAGEISRYQIMPSVWKHYSGSLDYHDPDTSLEVARQHWSALYNYFKKRTNRAPTDFDMYVLWNTRYGYYASKGFDPARVNPVVRDRAQRFTNLVELGASREAGMAGNKGA